MAQIPAAGPGPAFWAVNLSSMGVAWDTNGNPVDVTTYTVVLTTEPAFPNVNDGNVSLSTLPAGSSLAATLASLDPNTTYYLFVAAQNHAGLLTAYADLSTAAATLAFAPIPGALQFLSIQYSTVTVAWAALALSPPAASSMTARGYVLEASSNNFGALAPPGAPITSSMTFSVLKSTLSLAGLDLASTYYFRVGSLNHQGRANYTPLSRLNFQIKQSTDSMSFGQMGMVAGNLVISTVATSSMVVTNVGNWPMTIALSASTQTVGNEWILGTARDVEVAVLQGLWYSGDLGPPAVGPPAAAFSTFLTTTPTVSQASGNYSSPSQNGYQLPPGASISLWVQFFLPTSTVNSGSQRLQVAAQPVYP